MLIVHMEPTRVCTSRFYMCFRLPDKLVQIKNCMMGMQRRLDCNELIRHKLDLLQVTMSLHYSAVGWHHNKQCTMERVAFSMLGPN